MTTVQIIQLPSAAASPVIQTKKCGRHPKTILLFREARWAQRRIELDRQEIAEEIERVRHQILMNERMGATWRESMAKLSRPNMSPIECAKLAAEIRYENLS